MKCEIVGCSRAAQFQFAGQQVCMTHWRTIVIGEFGQKVNPPWTKEQAIDALINQDGMDREAAQKRVNDFFDRKQKPK